jgi:sulfofructose kinase
MIAPRSILFVGALTHDTIFRFAELPVVAGKYLPDQSIRIAAGMAASAATSARRLGASATLWASVGDDLVADQLIREMQEEQVDCRAVRRVQGGRSAAATILVDAAGERIIVVDYDPITQKPPDRFPFKTIADFDAVLVDARWPGAARIALAMARKANIPAILDADVAPRGVLLELGALATHIVASDPGAAIICGKTCPPHRAVAQLSSRFDAFIAITAGGAGTFWYDRQTSDLRHTPAPDIKPVDTLAAGDVFHGSFATALSEARDIEYAIRFASAAAALKCLKFGGRLGAPDRAQTLKMMEQGRNE